MSDVIDKSRGCLRFKVQGEMGEDIAVAMTTIYLKALIIKKKT